MKNMSKLNKTGKWTRRAALTVAAGGAAAGGVPTESMADVVIHNDGFTADNQALPGGQAYGSNAGANDANWSVSVGAWGILGAPNIELFWDGEGGGSSGFGFDTYTAWNGTSNSRGNVVQMDGSAAGGTPNFAIIFSPTPDFAVSIRSFELDAWAGGGDMEVDWSIENAGMNILASGKWTKSNAGGRDAIAPDVVGSLGESLTLRFNRISGAASYLAIDNLTFAQAVPEPSSSALVIAGLGAMAMRRRNRS
jgi:hypothetical protein